MPKKGKGKGGKGGKAGAKKPAAKRRASGGSRSGAKSTAGKAGGRGKGRGNKPLKAKSKGGGGGGATHTGGSNLPVSGGGKYFDSHGRTTGGNVSLEKYRTQPLGDRGLRDMFGVVDDLTDPLPVLQTIDMGPVMARMKALQEKSAPPRPEVLTAAAHGVLAGQLLHEVQAARSPHHLLPRQCAELEMGMARCLTTAMAPGQCSDAIVQFQLCVLEYDDALLDAGDPQLPVGESTLNLRLLGLEPTTPLTEAELALRDMQMEEVRAFMRKQAEEEQQREQNGEAHTDPQGGSSGQNKTPGEGPPGPAQLKDHEDPLREKAFVLAQRLSPFDI